jgi:hypothetical protein
MPSPRPATTREAQAALQYAIGTVSRANPVVATWHWRYELAAAAALAAPWIALGTAAAAGLTGGLGATLVLTACFSRGRRFLAARAWCIVTAHRVRTGCAQAWIHTRYGKLPLILWTRSRPSGELVYLWCRAGTSAADFSSARELLAAACMAKDIKVSQHARYAHLIMLDVIRCESPAAWNGHPWYDIGSPNGSPAIPSPREPANDAYWLGEPPHEQPARWIPVCPTTAAG